MKQFRGLALIFVAAASVAYGAPVAKETSKNTLLAAGVPGSSGGQSSETEAPSITTTLPSAPVSAVTGFLDLRPTMDLSTKNDVRLETSVGLGYKFTKDVAITAEQPFWSNINGEGPGSLSGTMLREGHVRLDVKNIAKSGPLSFGYQVRAYYPSRAAWRDNGFITQIRNAFYVTAQATPSWSLTLFEVPIVHVFNQPNGPGGVNPGFENRVILSSDWSLLGGKLSISLPIFFHQFKMREASAPGQKFVSGFATPRAGAKADDWFYSVWISPEIMYNVTKELQIGVSYDSGELAEADLSNLTIGKGLSEGAPKLALRMSL